MTKTPCEGLSDRIVDYVDGELPQHEAQIVAQHLSECPRCRQTANDLEKSLRLATIIWQENLADTMAAAPVGRPWKVHRGSLYVLAIAASLLFAAGLLVLPVSRQSPSDPTITAEQIEGQVARAGLAAELLAATQMIVQCEGTESIVERQYQYILREYADTPAAKTIRASLGSGGM